MLPENDRWTDASLSRIFYDRLNCSKDMKLLEGGGHFPIEKEGLMHLEQYCVEFWKNVWRSAFVSNCQWGSWLDCHVVNHIKDGMIILIETGCMIVWENARMEERILQIIKGEDSKNPPDR